MHGDQRMAVPQAGSIYDTGHQVIKNFGFQVWLDRLLAAINRRFDSSHFERGIQPYCNLGILPVGGGAASLSPPQLEALRRRMQDWAGRRSHFLENHKAYLVFPTRRSEAFQVLGDPLSQTLDMQTTDLNVHIPSRNACVFADTTLSLRVAGQGALIA